MLQPRQFFHASKANLTPGVDQIRPANDVGGSNYGYSHHDNDRMGWSDEPDRGDHTFAADTETEAEAWTPSGHGRPVTYVVDPGEDYEEENQHYMTRRDDYASIASGTKGIHAKVRGPMDIVDRIDIPRPNHPDEVVQGTLPPQNWGHFNGLPKGYEGPATVGQQHPETDNFKRTSPEYERMKVEQSEKEQYRTRDTDRYLYEEAWKDAGQQELPLGQAETYTEGNQVRLRRRTP